MVRRKPSAASDVTIEKHRPERWLDRAVVGSICCSSCCCCCCCLHSVGAIGGAVAGNGQQLLKASGEDADARKGAVLATFLYWGGFLGTCLAGVLFAVVMDETLIALAVIAMGTPTLQLVGSVFALPAMLIAPGLSGKKAAARVVGVTAVGSLLGGLFGGAVMALLMALVIGVGSIF